MFKKKNSDKRTLTLIDKDLIKNHSALANIKHHDDKSYGVKVYYLDKYEYMWSLQDKNKTEIKNPAFPGNVFRELGKSGTFELILVFDPKEDINTEYFARLIEEYDCRIYIAQEYSTTLVRKYLDSVDACTIYTSAYELEDMLQDYIDLNEIYSEEDS